MDSENEPKQILKPRNPGEGLKIAETVLRKRNRDLKSQAERARKRLELKKEAKRVRIDLGVVTPEKLVKNGIVKQLDAKRIARLKNQKNNPRVQFHDRVKTIFVVRNARNPPSKASLAVLKSLNLTKKYTATFVPNCSDELVKLRHIQPFVFYGFLDSELLQALFMKHLRFNRANKPQNQTTEEQDDETAVDSSAVQRADEDQDSDDVDGKDASFAVSDNVAVEERLSHMGILCIDDVVAVVKNCTPEFQHLMTHIAPFQLGDILKAEGVDANAIANGDLGFKINSKVSKLM